MANKWQNLLRSPCEKLMLPITLCCDNFFENFNFLVRIVSSHLTTDSPRKHVLHQKNDEDINIFSKILAESRSKFEIMIHHARVKQKTCFTRSPSLIVLLQFILRTIRQKATSTTVSASEQKLSISLRCVSAAWCEYFFN